MANTKLEEEKDNKSKVTEQQVENKVEKKGIADTIKKKVVDFWNKLNIYDKFTTSGILIFALLGAIAFLCSKIVSGIIAVLSIILLVVALLMKKQIIKNTKKWLPILIMVVSFILIIPYFSLFKISAEDYERYEWNDVVLSNIIEQPKSPYGEIISNSNKYLSLYVNNTSKSNYADYIKTCKEKGFNVDIEQTGNSFYAYNSDGYKLSIYYYESDKKMNISIDAPRELGTLKWSESELAKLVPVPKSTVGNIEKDEKASFVAYVGNTTKEEYNNYITLCSDKGFNVNSSKTDKSYSAKNEQSYKISIEYVGNNVMKITIYEPQYNVSLEIQCVENWIFSQYDVKVYLNDNYEGTITHGGTETYSAVLNKGKHTIKFVSAEDDTLTGNVDVDISKDETLKFKISCSSFGISVQTIEGTTVEQTEPENKEENVSNETASSDTTTDNKEETSTAEMTLEMELEKTFPKEYAKRAVVVAMTNGSAIDVFKADKSTYDISKFHSYADTSGFYLDIYKEGTWTAKSENTWHVENMKLAQTKKYSGGLIKVTADVTYNGENYILSKVHKVNANEKYIDSDDPNKVSWEDLEPRDSNPFLTVPKNLIEKNRTDNGSSNELDKNAITSAAKTIFENYGKSKYPYGFKCHWVANFIACEVRYDGSCYIKVGVTITNQYGTERETVAEGIVNGSNVDNFYVSN